MTDPGSKGFRDRNPDKLGSWRVRASNVAEQSKQMPVGVESVGPSS